MFKKHYIYQVVHIRTAKFKELEVIADFQVRMAEETEGLRLNRENILRGVEAVFEDPGKGTYFVAIDHDEQVLACLLITPEWSEWRNGTVYWFQSVYVMQDYRGTGIFRQMYEHVKAIVEEDEDLVGLRLYVEKDNVKAQQVYEKLGMDGDHYKMYEWMK